jgi:leucyl aminopeptidase
MEININIINNNTDIIDINNNNISLALYINYNYKVENIINKLANYLNIYTNIKSINITFDNSYTSNNKLYLITKLDNIFYYMKKKNIIINYNNIDNTCTLLLKYLESYKDIVLETNKTPDTYLNYIKKNLPQGYRIKIFTINKNDTMFPLTSAVGQGSQYNTYFVYIYKDQPNKNGKNIVFIGKSITYDSGGLNIKIKEMDTMKIDMTGSAILLNVLNLLVDARKDNNNLHLLFPIAENMISNTAIRPGMVVKSSSGINVEIIDSDAEGRLCIADAIEYFNKFIKSTLDSPILLDISTLTNTTRVAQFGGIVMYNNKGKKLTKKLIKIGDRIGEYLETINFRDEYNIFLNSQIADIKNYSSECIADTTFAGMFCKYFVDNEIPYIHIDIGCSTYDNNKINSYGILLLYKFIKRIK